MMEENRAGIFEEENVDTEGYVEEEELMEEEYAEEAYDEEAQQDQYDEGYDELDEEEEYAEEERKFTVLTEDDLRVLQDVYHASYMILKQLENTSITTRSQLATICGADKDKFNEVMNVLTHNNFIRWRMDKIIPSEKLRVGLTKIDRNIDIALKEV